MIDYYETKSQPITRLQVWEAYRRVRAEQRRYGIDGMNWDELDRTGKPNYINYGTA